MVEAALKARRAPLARCARAKRSAGGGDFPGVPGGQVERALCFASYGASEDEPLGSFCCSSWFLAERTNLYPELWQKTRVHGIWEQHQLSARAVKTSLVRPEFCSSQPA